MIFVIRGAAVIFVGTSVAGVLARLVPPPAQVQAITMQADAPILTQFRACLMIADMTKERLDCYDSIVSPKPNAVHVRAKTIVDCRFVKEEDERLICFNSFLADRPTAKPTNVAIIPAPPPPLARHVTTTRYVRRGRGGCGSRGGPGYRLPSGKCAGHRR